MSERKRKFDADKQNPAVNKSVWNDERKKWTNPLTQTGYLQPTVREIFPDLSGERCDATDFKSATKFVTRCLEKFERGDFDAEENNTSKKFRLPGAGPPVRALEVRDALFDYFIDIRGSLKGRLPLFMLHAKAIELYEKYCELKQQMGETPEKLTINDSRVKRWANDRHISLRSPNNDFQFLRKRGKEG